VTTLSTAPAERSLRVWDDQLQVRVLVAGSGPPLVYFHPAGGLTWDGFLDALTQQFTVYAPEHPGTTPGDPRAIDRVDDMWDLVVMYQEVLEQLGLERPVLMGESFGGMVACEVAAYAPERVSKLVLLAPLGLWRDDLPVRNPMIVSQDELRRLLFADPDGEAAGRFFGLPEEQEARVEAQVDFTWSQACTGKFVWPIPDRGLRKHIHRVGAPTLVVWGRQDGVIAPAYADEFARRIRGARVELIDRAGHLPHLEQSEAVARLVREFLSA
jgi:pimeloyl-ACP methyl ester carboxylesterase